MEHTRDDYLEAITASGLTILEVMDIPVGEAPAVTIVFLSLK
jgi:hypothetical protein